MIKQLSIYTNDNYITVVGKKIDTTEHKHYSHQITIGQEACTFVPSMVSHHLTTNVPFAVILVNPISEDGRRLSQYTEAFTFNFPLSKLLPNGIHDYEHIQSLYNQLIDTLLPDKPLVEGMDKRINEAIEYIHTLDTKKISSADLAKEVYLSESRLAHLFKDEIGVPLRRYLLWLKLKDAIELVPNSSSFTEAAHTAGFSDAAHMARTCREQFGIDLSNLFKHSRFIQVVSEDS